VRGEEVQGIAQDRDILVVLGRVDDHEIALRLKVSREGVSPN